MEGLWFAYNAQNGRPVYQQVKVLDHTEHPGSQPGKPVVVFPSSIGGFNYSPASFDPNIEFRPERRRGDRLGRDRRRR